MVPNKKQRRPLATETEPASLLFDLDVESTGNEPGLQHSPRLPPHRRSSPSSSSSLADSGPHSAVSCVALETSAEDCARNRFIVWAAVKRNRSTRMAAHDRLKCPLVLCGESFDDHESMLRHLAKCQHLATGEYLCFECMKVERFNDGNCRCCLGQPTKRRRIINKAKNFFSSIGQRARRESHSPASGEQIPGILAPPPSYYESLVVDASEQNRQQEEEGEEGETSQQNQQPDHHQPRPQIELNGAEILELDSSPLFPEAELAQVNYDLDSHMDIDSYGFVAEIAESAAQSSLPTGPTSYSSHTERSPQTEPNTTNPFLGPPPISHASPGQQRPSLNLNTCIDQFRSLPRAKYLSPGSSLQSAGSSHRVSPVTAWSASSPNSAGWTLASSLDTTMTSPESPFSSIGFSAGAQSAQSAQPHQNEPSQQQSQEAYVRPTDIECYPKGRGNCDDNRHMERDRSELPGDNPLSLPALHEGPELYPFDAKDNYSWISSASTELSLGTSVNMMFNDNRAVMEFGEQQGAGGVAAIDTKAWVESSWWAVLRQHVSTSFNKLHEIGANPLAGRLRAESTKSIAAKGLTSLRAIIEGHDPTDPLEYLCLVHVVYAMAFVMYEGDGNLETRCRQLHKQAKAYRGFLSRAYFEVYTQVVDTLWQPLQQDPPTGGPFATVGRGRPSAGNDVSSSVSGRSLKARGQEPEYRYDPARPRWTDPLLVMGQNYADEVETSVIIGQHATSRQIEVLGSELWSTHLSEINFMPPQREADAFAIAANYIVQILDNTFQSLTHSLSPRLKVVAQRVQSRNVSTTRRLELELLQAGKPCFTSADWFDSFIPKVREMCDQVYQQQSSNPRSKYHSLSVSLLEHLVQSFGNGRPSTMLQHQELPLNLTDPYTNMNFFQPYEGASYAGAGNMNQNLFYSYPHPQSAHAQNHPAQHHQQPPHIVPSQAATHYELTNPVFPPTIPSNANTPTGRAIAGVDERNTRPIRRDTSTSDTPISEAMVVPAMPSPAFSATPSTTAKTRHNNLASARSTPSTQGGSGGSFDLPRVASTETMAGAAADLTFQRHAPAGHQPVSTPPTDNVGVASEETSGDGDKTEAEESCSICGYRPKGNPRWFQGSMAKHRKTQHAEGPPRIYQCPFPGCKSAYKNRQDNLRQHQIEKGHFVQGEEEERRRSKSKSKSRRGSGRRQTGKVSAGRLKSKRRSTTMVAGAEAMIRGEGNQSGEDDAEMDEEESGQFWEERMRAGEDDNNHEAYRRDYVNDNDNREAALSTVADDNLHGEFGLGQEEDDDDNGDEDEGNVEVEAPYGGTTGYIYDTGMGQRGQYS